MSEILVKLEAAQPRRMFGVLAMIGLGLVLLYIVATYPPSKPVALVSLMATGMAFIWASTRLYRATTEVILLTREAITTESGDTICRIEDIASVDRGFFAFKPSNGFLIRTKTSRTRSWAPGMWWSFGKNIGIGGVTHPRQGKEMVSIIQMMLIERKTAEANKD